MREALDWEKEGSSMWKIYRNRSLGSRGGMYSPPTCPRSQLVPSPQPGKEFVFLLSLVLPWCPSGPMLLSPMPSCGV